MNTAGQRRTLSRSSRVRCREEFESAESDRDIAVKREVRAIDKELGNYQSLAELDFRAGFVTGKIYEKESAGVSCGTD